MHWDLDLTKLAFKSTRPLNIFIEFGKEGRNNPECLIRDHI